ncbi:MAG: spermidine synthase [Caulobacteraceae bacterium]|nr:spermidine synthase [Caulobacteraceae bacterium]
MKPWIHIDSAQMPDDGGELRLMRRDAEYSIMAGAIELMNSRLSGSEEALASLTWERIEGRPAPRVLIGGLGMGFTLRAALAAFPPSAEIVVGELVPAVIAWARGPLAHIFAGCLDDPRVRVIEADVGRLIGEAPDAWDAILLDVDNGPEGLTRRANDQLYDLAGLARARAALRPGGVLAVWSSRPDEGFTRRKRRSGLSTEMLRVPARKGGRGARHVIWLGRR